MAHLSLFDIFKISVGPSSSHTMGPMLAAARFLDELRALPFSVAAVSAVLQGSLAFTGKGHATDRAVILGLGGLTPEHHTPEKAEAILRTARERRLLAPEGLGRLRFDPARDILFDHESPTPHHPNTLLLRAHDAEGDVIHERSFLSIGGGFVVTPEEMGRSGKGGPAVPHPFDTADALLAICRREGLAIAEVQRLNELATRSAADLDEGIERIFCAMMDSIARGLAAEGTLPGGLAVRRRAGEIFRKLEAERGRNLVPPHAANDWLAAFAMAVNEENAAGGRIVTAPTNGAAGVIPAVLRYWLDHVPGATREATGTFLLTAAAIGGLIKRGASISGAECGCQAEVGSAAAMAAAGLAAVMGATPPQVENAAEIALEHHLGMTCDPVKGLVQIPCIERNAMGAVKAVAAASLALRGTGDHLVPLDVCIRTMRTTGEDMSAKYKETALGGLAAHLPVTLPEC